MTGIERGNLKTLKPKEGDVLRCVESPHSWWTVGKEYTATSDGMPVDDDGDTYGQFGDFQSDVIFEVVKKARVPVGYTGKLKNMDLREGDVVGSAFNGIEYTIKDGRLGSRPVELCIADYTLISRANPWSNWHMSRKDGSYDTKPNCEYETHELPDTDQVMYRWRELDKKEPVVEWVNADVSAAGEVNTYFLVKTIDGEPQWETLEYVPD